MPSCPRCSSERVIRNGASRAGEQTWLCRACGKRFVLERAPGGDTGEGRAGPSLLERAPVVVLPVGDARDAGRLEVALLGPASLRLGGPLLLPAKAVALVAYLALTGPVRRAKLADLLWSGVDEETARKNLRQLLYRLKATALGDWLVAGEHVVSLDRPLETDVARFREACREGRLQAALALYRGPLLDGLELAGASAFEG